MGFCASDGPTLALLLSLPQGLMFEISQVLSTQSFESIHTELYSDSNWNPVSER